jgi:hypothetical protein
MLKYRAIRRAGETVWLIEIFDTTHQIAYEYNNLNSTKRSFLSKVEAESFIRKIILEQDQGEMGDWFDGPF